MKTTTEKGKAFRELHRREGAFVIPNPWDVGSARMLAALGFEALATTSTGLAWASGRSDGEMGLDNTLAHCRALAMATDLPVSADFEHCFADAPKEAAANLVRAAETGLVGASIEDFTGDAAHPIYDFNLAVERVQAAAEAVHALDFPFTLTARAENLLHGINDLDDSLRRLQAFEAAGADVLYAPGLRTLEQVRTVTAVLDKPVNVLAPMVGGATVGDLAAAGARRLSVGGALCRAAFGAMLRAAHELHDQGGFSWLGEMAVGDEMSRLVHAATPSP
ncbi:MAG: isocitrate lyase/PEP mutase family protein [Gammaproteobacteria bacterium]